jgi:hypothetical protein
MMLGRVLLRINKQEEGTTPQQQHQQQQQRQQKQPRATGNNVFVVTQK